MKLHWLFYTRTAQNRFPEQKILGNDRMETTSTEVTSIQSRNDIEKSIWRTHRYSVDFESWNHFEIYTLNLCHNCHVYSPFKIDVISTNVPRAILTSNQRRIDEDVSIVLKIATKIGIHHRFFIGDNSTRESSLVESFLKYKTGL